MIDIPPGLLYDSVQSLAPVFHDATCARCRLLNAHTADRVSSQTSASRLNRAPLSANDPWPECIPRRAVSGACPGISDRGAAVFPVTSGERDGATHDFEGHLAAASSELVGNGGIMIWIR